MTILAFQLNTNLFLRDPQSTDLGRNIIFASTEIIDRIGFDHFTFKKLALDIHSTEASIYRYFENKHRLLLYLMDWYWTWLEHKMDYGIQNIESPEERFKRCVRILVEEKKKDEEIPFVDVEKLQRIVHAEFEKTYLTKQVDSDNKEGLFLPYKALCKKIASIIVEINPDYLYPHSLASTLVLTANHQLYYADHLPSLTDIKLGSKNKYDQLAEFLEYMVLSTITAKAR
jgi:AcrR family transcriptional regulator